MGCPMFTRPIGFQFKAFNGFVVECNFAQEGIVFRNGCTSSFSLGQRISVVGLPCSSIHAWSKFGSTDRWQSNGLADDKLRTGGRRRSVLAEVIVENPTQGQVFSEFEIRIETDIVAFETVVGNQALLIQIGNGGKDIGIFST